MTMIFPLNIPFDGEILNIKYPDYYLQKYIKKQYTNSHILTVYKGKKYIKYQKMED
jgi:hypothetical protein